MPQNNEAKKSIYNDLGLESQGIKFEDFVSKFDADSNLRKSVFNDLGLADSGVTFETFEDKLGLKKKDSTSANSASVPQSTSQNENIYNQVPTQSSDIIPQAVNDPTGTGGKLTQPIDIKDIPKESDVKTYPEYPSLNQVISQGIPKQQLPKKTSVDDAISKLVVRNDATGLYQLGTNNLTEEEKRLSPDVQNYLKKFEQFTDKDLENPKTQDAIATSISFKHPEISKKVVLNSLQTSIALRDDLRRSEMQKIKAPNDVNTWYTSGQLKLQSGDLANAEKDFMRGLQINPNDNNILSGLGYLQMKKQNYDDAISLYSQVFQQDQSQGKFNASALNNISNAYLQKGDYQQAQNANDLFIKATGGDTDSYSIKANLDLAKGDTDAYTESMKRLGDFAADAEFAKRQSQGIKDSKGVPLAGEYNPTDEQKAQEAHAASLTAFADAFENGIKNTGTLAAYAVAPELLWGQSALGMMEGSLHSFGKIPDDLKKKEYANATGNLVAAAIDGLFAVGTAKVPAMREFMSKMAVAETVLPSELLEPVFAPISFAIDKMGGDTSGLKDYQKEILNVADLLGSMVLFHKGEKLGKPLAEKIKNNIPLTKAEASDVANTLSDITPEEVSSMTIKGVTIPTKEKYADSNQSGVALKEGREANVGKNVNYQGIDGTLTEKGGDYFVVDSKGEEHLIEGGTSDATNNEIGLTRGLREDEKVDVAIDRANKGLDMTEQDFEVIQNNWNDVADKLGLTEEQKAQKPTRLSTLLKVINQNRYTPAPSQNKQDEPIATPEEVISEPIVTATPDMKQTGFDISNDNNTVTIYGKKYEITGVGKDKNLKTVSLEVVDENGKKKQIRNQQVVDEYNLQVQIAREDGIKPVAIKVKMESPSPAKNKDASKDDDANVEKTRETPLTTEAQSGIPQHTGESVEPKGEGALSKKETVTIGGYEFTDTPTLTEKDSKGKGETTTIERDSKLPPSEQVPDSGVGSSQPVLKKVKSFKTDEGNFDVYDIEKDVRGRADMFTVLKDKSGYIVRNALVPENLQRKKMATDFYIKMNEESIAKTGNPLRSTQPRKLVTGEIVHELSKDAIALWDSFVTKGLAEKKGEKNYRFNEPRTNETNTPASDIGLPSTPLVEGQGVESEKTPPVEEGKEKPNTEKENLKPKKNETDNTGTKSESDSEAGSSSKEVAPKRKRGNFTPLKKRKIKLESYKQALRVETSNPIHKVMQYFIGGGKIHGGRERMNEKKQPLHAMQQIFGTKDEFEKDPVTGKFKFSKKVQAEANLRIGLLKNDAPTIDELAHALWENQDEHGKQYDDMEFRDAVERVLLDHNGTASMVKEINDTYGKYSSEAEMEWQKQFEGIDPEINPKEDADLLDEHEQYFDSLTDEQKNELVEHLDDPAYMEKVIAEHEAENPQETKRETISDKEQRLSEMKKRQAELQKAIDAEDSRKQVDMFAAKEQQLFDVGLDVNAVKEFKDLNNKIPALEQEIADLKVKDDQLEGQQKMDIPDQPKEPYNKKIADIKAERNKAIDDLRDMFGKLGGEQKFTSWTDGKKDPKFFDTMVRLGKTYLDEGLVNISEWSKRLYEDLKKLKVLFDRSDKDFQKDIADIYNKSKSERWKNIDPKVADSIQQKMNFVTKEKLKQAKRLTWEKFYKGWVRKMEDTSGNVKEWLRKNGGIDTVMLKDIANKSDAKAAIKIKEYEEKLFADLSEKQLDDLGAIIQAKRIIQLDEIYDKRKQPKLNHEGSHTKEFQEAQLKGMEERIGKETFDDLSKRADGYFEAMQKTLDAKLENGLITKGAYEALLEQSMYSPRMFIQHMNEIESGLNAGKKVSVGSNGIKRLDEGSEGYLEKDPRFLLATSLSRAQSIMAKNDATKSLLDWIDKNPDNGVYERRKIIGNTLTDAVAKEVNSIEEKTGVTLSPNDIKVIKDKHIQKALDKKIADFTDKNNSAPTQIQIDNMKASAEKGDHIYQDLPTGKDIISAIVNGERQDIIADKDVVNEWTTTDPEISTSLAQAIGWITQSNLLRYTATGINQLFAFANPPRDMAYMYFTTDAYSKVLPKAIAQIHKDMVEVSKDAFTRSGRFKEFMEEGGGIEYLTHQGRFDLTKGVNEGINRGSQILSYVGETSELLTRLAMRERGIKNRTEQFVKDNGRQPNATELKEIKVKSTYDAINQLDFSQGGSWTKAINKFIPYFNATFQASRGLVRAAKHDSKSFAIKAAQFMALAGGLTAYNLMQDGYDEVSDDEKTRHYIFMLGGMYSLNKDGQKEYWYIKIPKSQETQFISAIAENAVEFTSTGKSRPKQIMEGLSNATAPIPFLTQNPPISEAIRAYKSNYDEFYDRKLWYGSENISPELEYNVSGWNKTPSVYRNIGEKLGWSPERLRQSLPKVLVGTEKNPVFTIPSKIYQISAAAMDKKDSDELNKTFSQHINDMFGGVKDKYIGKTRPEYKTPVEKEEQIKKNDEAKLASDKLKILGISKKTYYQLHQSTPPEKLKELTVAKAVAEVDTKYKVYDEYDEVKKVEGKEVPEKSLTPTEIEELKQKVKLAVQKVVNKSPKLYRVKPSRPFMNWAKQLKKKDYSHDDFQEDVQEAINETRSNFLEDKGYK